MSNLVKIGEDVKPAIIANNIIDKINNGELDPLRVAVAFKRVEKIINAVCGTKGDKDVKNAIAVEVQKYATNGKAPAFGAMVEYASTYTKYDYSVCNHSEYNELARIITTCKARMKEIEKELRSVPVEGREKPITQMPSLNYYESGEVVDLYPPTKHQTMGAKIFV
jgi:hypothetical protein